MPTVFVVLFTIFLTVHALLFVFCIILSCDSAVPQGMLVGSEQLRIHTLCCLYCCNRNILQCIVMHGVLVLGLYFAPWTCTHLDILYYVRMPQPLSITVIMDTLHAKYRVSML